MRSLRLFLLLFSSLLLSFFTLPRLSFEVIGDFEMSVTVRFFFVHHLTSPAKRLRYSSYFFANDKLWIGKTA